MSKILYQKFKNNLVKCRACAHYCLIPKDKFGLCGTRQNIKGSLTSKVYGKVAAIGIDPIEKKPLYHFLPGTMTFSIGTLGCNFRCPWCQNFGISQITKEKNQPSNWGTTISPQEIVNLAKKYHCPSIAYTYNEPAIFIEFVHDTAALAHKSKIKNLIVSNGYLSKESIKLVAKYLDAANIDLKSYDDRFYQQFCGAKLQPVLNTIEKLYQEGVHLEITTLLIPQKNDSVNNLKKIAKFIASISPEIPWHLSRFFPTYKMKDTPPTARQVLEEAKKIGEKAGLKNIYLGNI